MALYGATPLMELNLELFAKRRAFDPTTQWCTHEGWALPKTADGTAAWIICNHTYDVNGNRIATKWASNDLSTKWTDYATLNYT